jgi:hypothetical protein
VLPLKDKGVRDGGRRDTREVTVGSMVEVRLLQMFPRGCRAQSAEHCGQGIYVGIQRYHRTVQWLPLQRGGGVVEGLWW